MKGQAALPTPMVSESVTQFQAQAYKELLPSGGPVRTNIVGLKDAAREEQATRVKDFMNFQITEVMEEYDPDMDQMLFYLPLSGSTFKKVYFDPTKQRRYRSLFQRRIWLYRIQLRIWRRRQGLRTSSAWMKTK